MQSETLKKLVNDIITKKAESQTIEIKSAEHGCSIRFLRSRIRMMAA